MAFYYTNFTNDEIDKTLEYYVEAIKRLLNGGSPIGVEYIRKLSSKYSNLDFYDMYFDWCKQPQNTTGDYDSFLRYLKKEVSIHLKKMKFKKFESHEQLDRSGKFNALFEDFRDYKSRRYKGSEGSIRVDIENYLYMLDIGEQEHCNSILDKKNFFISADHTYIDWAAEKMPGAIPTFVLPSVRYSIMLKYSGRSNDDYNAFCQFLKIRVPIKEDDKLIESKEKMLAYILSLDESSSIKEEIIFDIDQRLSASSIDIEDVETYVEESHRKITDKKVNEAIAETQNSFKEERSQLAESAEKAGAQKLKEGEDKGRLVGYQEGLKDGISSLMHMQAKKE